PLGPPPVRLHAVRLCGVVGRALEAAWCVVRGCARDRAGRGGRDDGAAGASTTPASGARRRRCGGMDGAGAGSVLNCPTVRPSDQQQLVLWGAGIHFWSRRVDVHIDLAANSEAPGQVDARLDREADTGDEGARVLGLEVVDVRPRAVEIAVDRMAGPMHEVLGQAGV